MTRLGRDAILGATLRCAVASLARTTTLAVLASHAAAQSPVPRFEPADCWVGGDWAQNVRRECRWLVVRESQERRTGRTLRLAVEIYRATEPNGTPPLVFLHGGPGGGGIGVFSESIARMAPLHRDVVIYDQRGAGFSEPKLCPTFQRLADAVYNLRDDAERERRLSGGRRACRAELAAQGADPFGYSTSANVADLIALRRTLGYASWVLFGGSYGARLAQEAMARDGRAIRAVILAWPMARGFSMHAEQSLSTQRALERVFAACGHDPGCRHAFPTVEQDFYTVYAELTKSPLTVPMQLPDGGGETVWVDGNRLVADIRERMGPKISELGRLPLLLHELRAGDRVRAAREMVGSAVRPAGFGGQVVRELVNCADHEATGAAYRKTLDSVNAMVRPPFRRAVDRECEDWLPELADRPMPAPVRSGIPTLIVTGHYDDRTPTDFGRRIAATLRRAYVVEFSDQGHGGQPLGCEAALMIGFVENPTLAPDTSCVATIPPIAFTTTWEPARAP